jgi:2,5-dioxopentanoate dehydrogenase
MSATRAKTQPTGAMLIGDHDVDRAATGVDVGHAVVHGGPYPATSDPRIDRFLRPVSYQNMPAGLRPPELAEDNPLRLWRRVDVQLGQH